MSITQFSSHVIYLTDESFQERRCTSMVLDRDSAGHKITVPSPDTIKTILFALAMFLRRGNKCSEKSFASNIM